jgi:hypothetical protein
MTGIVMNIFKNYSTWVVEFSFQIQKDLGKFPSS